MTTLREAVRLARERLEHDSDAYADVDLVGMLVEAIDAEGFGEESTAALLLQTARAAAKRAHLVLHPQPASTVKIGWCHVCNRDIARPDDHAPGCEFSGRGVDDPEIAGRDFPARPLGPPASVAQLEQAAREAHGWAQTARVALEAYRMAPVVEEGDELDEGERAEIGRMVTGYLEALESHKSFLRELHATFEGAGTPTSARVASRIERHLDRLGVSVKVEEHEEHTDEQRGNA